MRIIVSNPVKLKIHLHLLINAEFSQFNVNKRKAQKPTDALKEINL